jgi:hypothetical protein
MPPPLQLELLLPLGLTQCTVTTQTPTLRATRTRVRASWRDYWHGTYLTRHGWTHPRQWNPRLPPSPTRTLTVDTSEVVNRARAGTLRNVQSHSGRADYYVIKPLTLRRLCQNTVRMPNEYWQTAEQPGRLNFWPVPAEHRPFRIAPTPRICKCLLTATLQTEVQATLGGLHWLPIAP